MPKADLSDHTLLINKMIGLTTNTYGWPSILKTIGFRVELIEPRFLDSEGKLINPDLLFTSNKLCYGLITECKGGMNLNEGEKEQIERYSRINLESVRNKVSIHDPARLKIEVCISVNEKNKKICQEINKIFTFPTIIFADNFVNKENRFGNKEIENEFSSTLPITTKPPTSFYPFSDQDDPSIIALYIFQEFFQFTLKNKHKLILEIETEELLKGAHPFWDSIDEHKKKTIKSKVNSIIGIFKQKKLNDYLERIKGKDSWQIIKSHQAFGNECNKIIEELTKQQTISHVLNKSHSQ